MPAPGKYDEETRARAVRMYTERIRALGESKLTARRQVGAGDHLDHPGAQRLTQPAQITRCDRSRSTTSADLASRLYGSASESRTYIEDLTRLARGV